MCLEHHKGLFPLISQSIYIPTWFPVLSTPSKLNLLIPILQKNPLKCATESISKLDKIYKFMNARCWGSADVCGDFVQDQAKNELIHLELHIVNFLKVSCQHCCCSKPNKL